MNVVEKLVSLQLRGYGTIPHVLLRIMGVVIPKEVIFDDFSLGGARFVHGAVGTVFHPKTKIGRGVWIFQGVTIGKVYPWNPDDGNGGCVIKDDEQLIVGEGSIIAANAVLTQSTGPNEIWGGVPAKRIGMRKSL